MATILVHELQKILKSSTFFMLVATSIVLFALNGVAFTKILTERQAEYDLLRKEADGKLHRLSVSVAISPSIMSFMSEGGESKRPLGYRLNLNGGIYPAPVERNARLPLFPLFDWVFITKIIFFIYALLLIFNVVSGERESGTLPLVLANPVNRPRVLLGKYVAGVIGLSIPLLLGMLISLIVLSFSFPQILTGKILVSAGLYFTVALLFLSAIILLGLLISSLVRKSSLALLVLFAFWVGMMIAPNLSHLLANHLVRIMRDSEFTHASEQIETEHQEEMRSFTEKTRRNEFASFEEVHRTGIEIFTKYVHARKALLDERERSLHARAELSHTLSIISPLSVMQYAGEAISGTGHDIHRRLLKDLERNKLQLHQYFTEKSGHPPEYYGIQQGRVVTFRDSVFMVSRSFDSKADFSDSPVIAPSVHSIKKHLPLIMGYLSIILLWNLVLAAGAFLALNRADVR